MNDTAKIATPIGIYGALAAAQLEMGPVLKDAKNDAFKRDGKATPYATLGAVIEACMPALNKHGFAVLQPICNEDGKRYVKTILAHSSGETVECRVELILSKNDMQGYGSATTYARRFGLMCMAGVAPEDDDGNAASPTVEPHRDAVQRESQAKIGAAQAEAVSAAVRALMEAPTADALAAVWKALPREVQHDLTVQRAKDEAKAMLTKPAADLGGDAIPY